MADELDELIRQLPDTKQPSADQAKAIRSAIGRISAHTGTLKRSMGVGSKT